jgi:hypothetical protein
VISVTENSNKIQKTRFWKEKSVEDMDVFTLGPTAQTTLVCMKECISEVRTIQKVMSKIELVKCK